MQKEIQWLLKEKYSGKAGKKFNEDVERLKMGEPLDYVIGFTEFLGCIIDLSKKPLVPRPETEYWVERAINELNNPSSLRSSGQNLRILDIFSGSGCIGISIMRHTKNVKIIFAEKDKKFLNQIKINVKLNKKYISNQPSRAPVGPARELGRKIEKNNYKIVQSDVFKNIKGKFDYIFANPPYIPQNRKNKIQKSVLKYEPHAALFGGKEGLFYVRNFLGEAQNFLNPEGKVYMEFDYIQKREIEKLLKKYNYKSWKFKKDQYGKWRWVVICK